MRVRHPEFDFENASAHWGDHLEMVAFVNGASIIPTPIERYMIRVMRQARKQLDPVADADVIVDIDLFNKQEAQHFKLHAEYLEVIERDYPRIREYEAAFEVELMEFLKNESLAWNLSYCEGFESYGSATAYSWINGHIAEFAGDPNYESVAMKLWMWHTCEEYEHRSVVHDVLERLYGPEEAFVLRKAGNAFTPTHTGKHTMAAVAYINGVNRESMTEEEVAASIEREVASMGLMGSFGGDDLARIPTADYDPRIVEKPRDWELVLSSWGGGV